MTETNMKDLQSELKSINQTVSGINTDFHGFGIKFSEAQAAMKDQSSNIDALKKAFSDMEIRMAKNGQYSANMTKEAVFAIPEVKKMFDDYVRKGMSINNGPSGGYLVHPDYLAYVMEKVRDIDEIRANATVLSTSSSSLEIPVEDGDAGLVWVQETESRSETAAPTFGKVIIPVNEAQAKVRVTRTMRQDTAFSIDTYVTSKLIGRLMRGEAKAFVDGDGFSKPHGLWSNSDIETVVSGAAAALTIDGLLDLTAEVPWAMDSECKFIMNKKTEVGVRKLKDTTGQPLWNPSLIAGMPPTFAGYALVKAPSAPDVAANTFPVMFGALKDYVIVDRKGVEMIMDEISESLRAKNLVEFEFDTRIGGAVVMPGSFAKLKIAAS
ncbi:MAG: phage major capsid protein [Gudongella sp.]|nr:phage major capsid protein [Gudongella sp.]